MLVDAYEAALFDLDGVVYLGPEAVPGAPEGISALKDHGTRVAFVTNNAARPPQVVVEQLVGIGVPAVTSDVITAGQAGARMVAHQLPPGSRVLVVGTQALADEVRTVGLEPVTSADASTVAVLQGYDPQLTWPRIDDAVRAIQRGARWFATNDDLTRPTNTGLVPGAGAQIAAVGTAVRVTPEVAGKPFPPLLQETLRRLGTERAIFVGDRLDTDIEGASAVGIDSLFVFTGAHGKADLATAPAHQRPTHLGHDLRALLAPPAEVTVTGDGATCGGQAARRAGTEVRVISNPETADEQLDALRAALALAWSVDGGTVTGLDELDQLP